MDLEVFFTDLRHPKVAYTRIGDKIVAFML